MNPPSRDRRLAAAAALIGAAPFLLAPLSGLHLDDFSFLLMLEGVTAAELWRAFLQYVPGRNLHIPFFFALVKLTGGSVAAMQTAGLLLDALNAALMFALVLRLTGLRSVAFAAAAAFAVAPNHGETHYWITLIPQCRIPAALVLAAMNLAARARPFAACAVYAVALFTYDQVFFLWPFLLAASWRAERAPRPGSYAAAGLVLLGLNAAHLALRYLAPDAAGGRPLIRSEEVVHRVWDAAVAVSKGALPWPTSSHFHWAWSLPVVALAMAGAYWLLREARSLARAESGVLAAWTRDRRWRIAAAGGAAWTVLAYAPNLFWYLSPRHNLLPSIGWSLSLAAVGAWAVARDRRAAAAAPWAAGLLFTLAAVSDWHEGTQWVDSRRLRDSFDAAVRRLPQPVDAVFLIGAPRSLRRAPAFNLHHDVTMAAGRVLGRKIDAGDRRLSPTRRGFVYSNDLSLLPVESFRWLPAAKASVLSFDAAKRSFDCVAALRVRRPDGREETLGVNAGADCGAVPAVDADAYLLDARAEPPRAAAASGENALTLLGASASVRGETTVLALEWRVAARPTGPIAYIPRIYDAGGALALDAVFPARGEKSAYSVIWPLVDDLAAELPLKPGGTLRETFLLRRVPKPLGPGAELELDVFELTEDGYAQPLGLARAPLR